MTVKRIEQIVREWEADPRKAKALTQARLTLLRELATELSAERDQARAERDALRAACDGLIQNLDTEQSRTARYLERAERAEDGERDIAAALTVCRELRAQAEAERDALRALLAEARDCLSSCTCCRWPIIADIDAALREGK